MHCLIAAEKDSLEVILNNLRKLRPDIVFEACDDVSELCTLSKKRPDILLLSRFLPGEDARKLLKEVPVLFSTTHIVLLVGEMDEEGRTYIRLAREHGLTNYVTGVLPGDRPYTLPIALSQERETGNALEIKTNNETTEPIEEKLPEPEPPMVRCEPAYIGGGIEDPLEPLFVRDELAEKGLLVITTANKGGVGKTTTATTLAIALANVGIDVIVADLDLEGPNVSGFFGITPQKGIESLASRQQGLKYLTDQLLWETKYKHLRVLPGMVSKTASPDTLFGSTQIVNIINAVRQNAPVVIADTPPGFWAKPWLPRVFMAADIVLAIVDQSAFSKQDSEEYAPYILSMGVDPKKIKIVLNRFSPRLHNAKLLEKAFCDGFKETVPTKELPRIAVTIPNDWDAHGLKGYCGEAVGLDDARNQWHNLAEEIALVAGFRYRNPNAQKPKKSIRRILGLGGALLK